MSTQWLRPPRISRVLLPAASRALLLGVLRPCSLRLLFSSFYLVLLHCRVYSSSGIGPPLSLPSRRSVLGNLSRMPVPAWLALIHDALFSFRQAVPCRATAHGSHVLSLPCTEFLCRSHRSHYRTSPLQINPSSMILSAFSGLANSVVVMLSYQN
jgi:hypothetical protein